MQPFLMSEIGAAMVLPPREITVSQWADENRVLTGAAAAERGQWHTRPYQREPTGAGIGTMIMPGIGTAIGAGIGAAAGFVAGGMEKLAGVESDALRKKPQRAVRQRARRVDHPIHSG